VLGEANFSDHGANRLGASALMQGLADGYFILPYTIGDYFATARQSKPAASHPEFKQAEEQSKSFTRKLLSVKGKRTAASLHRDLGKILWEKCGMARNEAGLKEACGKSRNCARNSGRPCPFPERAKASTSPSSTPGALPTSWNSPNCFARTRSTARILRRAFSGGVPDRGGEAQRDDENFSYVAAWEYQGENKPPVLHKEPLVYEEVHMSTRSYQMNLTLKVWRQQDADASGRLETYEARIYRRILLSWKCWTSSTRD